MNGFRHGSWIAVHMAATVVGCRKAWLALGGPFLFFFAQICIESASLTLGRGHWRQFSLYTESLLMSVVTQAVSVTKCFSFV